MSENGRKALFYVCFFLFLILGAGVVLFAQGWRMDFPSFSISKVGGIYVRSYPENAQISLNGKSVDNQSGFLSRGTLISDLFPKTYRLVLTAPGYLDWHENVAVAPALVANHKFAVLIPTQGMNAASGTISGFKESRNGLVLETLDGEITYNGKVLGFGKLIAVSPDFQSIIFQTQKGIYEFADASDGTVKNMSGILSRAGFDTSEVGFSLDPLPNATVIAISQGKIASLDMTRSESSQIDAAARGQSIAAVATDSPDTIAFTHSGKATSSLFFYDLSSQNISSTTIPLGGSAKKMSWIRNGLLGILNEDGSLYLYDTGQQNLQKIADDVKDFSATQDGMRIATIESNSLEIFTLNDPEGYYRFNIPNISDAQNAFWSRDNDHLFIVYSNRVDLLDLEDASLANFTTVSLGTSPEYDPDANSLFIIDPANHLLRFDFAQ
jgi:hypothetical protein